MWGAAADLWYLFLRLARANLRMPVFMLISLVQPLVWVVLFGQLFASMARLPELGGRSYVQFLAPGISIMTALFAAAYSGMGMLGDIDRGVLDRMLATPVARGALLAARILMSSVQVVVQCAIILAVAAAIGARPHGGPGGVAAVLLAAALLGAAVAACSNALALVARRQEVVIAVMNFVVLPATFSSSMLIAGNLIPPWIRWLARFNPVNWAVVAARGGFEGAWRAVLPSLVALAAFALAAGWLASLTFRRYRRAA